MRQKVVAGSAVAVLLGGGAFAAVSATGQGNGHRRVHARRGVHRLHRHDLLAAATYLGISSVQLERELDSSKSLAQVAQAHPGKTTQGLIDAIVAARRARLAKVASRLPARVGAEVNSPAGLLAAGARSGKKSGRGSAGLGGPGPFTAAGRLGVAAADYLGITAAQLRRELQSGKTLAQVADATPGKSSAGLVAALVAARKQRLASGLAGGKMTHARAARREQRLHEHMSALVTRKFVRAGKP